MRFLLTNDDGFDAYGINLVKELLSPLGEVIIVAPKTAMSAKSVSIILNHPIEVNKVNDELYVLDATPADCVAFGLDKLGKFDLVISGCNHGLNVSYDTMYSGTVGACLQALTYQVPAIAISCENNFEIVKKHFLEVLDYIKKENLLSKEYLLNINFPLGDECRGIKITHLHYRKEVTYYKEVGENKYQALRTLHDEDVSDENSDIYAIRHQLISITKLHKTLEYKGD